MLFTTVVNDVLRDAARWRPGQPLQTVPFGANVYASGISHDGSIVYANSTAQVSNRYAAMLWNDAAGVVQTLPFTVYWYGYQYPVSRDGSWLGVGNERWHTSGAMTPIPDTVPFPPYGSSSLMFVPGPGQFLAGAISDDGQRVSGTASYSSVWYNSDGHSGVGPGGQTGATWTEGTGTVRGDAIVSGLNIPAVQDMSDDGAFGVTMLQQGLVRLDFATQSYTVIPGFSPSTDGEPVIAGNGAAILARYAYWSAGSGVITIPQALTQGGIDLTGWSDFAGYYISDDGRTVVGTARWRQGATQWWYATIPSPGFAGMAFAVLVMGAQRRHR